MIFAILARILNKFRPNWPAFTTAIILLLICTAVPVQAQLSVPLTIQEALYPGAPTQGISRTQDPVTVGIPLPDSAGIANINQLGLSGTQRDPLAAMIMCGPFKVDYSFINGRNIIRRGEFVHHDVEASLADHARIMQRIYQQ